MDQLDTKLTLDDLKATAIAIKLKSLPENLDVSTVFPYLYEHGVAIVTDNKGFILRCIVNVQLHDDHPVFVGENMQSVSQYTRIGILREIFETTGQKLVPLLDEEGRYTGFCASYNELQRIWTGQIEMPRLGGLATPLGVYLTTGIHATGSGTYGLVLTGVSFALFVLGARYSFFYLSDHYEIVHNLNQVLQIAIVFVLLLLIIRLSPMSGLHAAEHQAIHVIEKGLPLTPENIYKQPKAHKRCGTNIMVGLVGLEMAYVGLISIQPPEAGLVFSVIWVILLILGWQHIGLFVQNMFTTRKPSLSQVDNAIVAAKTLIDRYQARPHGNPNLWQRIWRSGMIQILFSFVFTYWLLEQIIHIVFQRNPFGLL